MRIIRFVNPNLRFFEGEGGDSGGGGPVDSGAGQSAPAQDNSQGQQEAAPQGGGVNPNWNEVLNLIPSQLHPGVIPHLKKWDDNFQTKLSEVQSQVEPWKQFEGQNPETIAQALQFWQLAESEPQRVFEALQEFLGGGNSDQGQQGQEGSPPEEVFDLDQDDILQHPKVQELLRGQEVIAQTLLAQQQKEQMHEFEQQVEAEQAKIMEDNPEFTEKELVLMYQIAAASNISLTDAAAQVKGYFGDVTQRTQAPHAPSVMSANGQVPAALPVDPTKLNRSDTKNLVADLIRQAQTGQG